MSKEKTIIDKIVDLVSTTKQTPEPQKHSDDAVAVDTPIDNVIALDKWVYLPDGLYTLESDGSKFRVSGAMIVEVIEGKESESDSTSTGNDASTDKTDEQSAQTPAPDKTTEQFSAINEKFASIEKALNSISELENKLNAIEKAVTVIGSKSSAVPVQRTEAMEDVKPKADLRQYFKTEKDYKDFVGRHTK